MDFPLVEASGGSSLAVVGRLFTAAAFLAVEHRLSGMQASLVAAPGL